MSKLILLMFIAVSALALANASPGEKSKKYCSETHVAKTERVKRMIGGETAAPKEFPHMVVLGYMEDGKKEWLCTGSLISDKYVLTIASCVNMKIPEYVQLGVTNMESDDENVKEVKITRIISHPANNQLSENDIALIELETKIEFNDYMRPACLNTENATSEADTFMAIGWGKIKNSFKLATLQKVTLKEVLAEECTKMYRNGIKINSETQICTNAETKGACTGDGGAPLQKLNPDFISTYDIYGMYSLGTVNCAGGFPSIFTRVSHYIDWIESIVFAN